MLKCNASNEMLWMKKLKWNASKQNDWNEMLQMKCFYWNALNEMP